VTFPEYGRDAAVDATDLPAYANGMRYVSKGGRERVKFSDPDASWGHRSAVSTRKGGGFFGYRAHLVTCARTGLPMVWRVETAKTHESKVAPRLLEAARSRGFTMETVSMDKGYDYAFMYEACEAIGALPVIPIRETTAVREGAADRPVCEHGAWLYKGTDYQRKGTKWRCPTGRCQPKSTWLPPSRYHPLIPRDTNRYRNLRAGRAAVERCVGRLKNEYGLTPLRVRSQERVALHLDLCTLALLASALARSRTPALLAA
jgi:hypothetical protein